MRDIIEAKKLSLQDKLIRHNFFNQKHESIIKT
jgi:hypothetical protein